MTEDDARSPSVVALPAVLYNLFVFIEKESFVFRHKKQRKVSPNGTNSFDYGSTWNAGT
jgi:hypothetical protein